VIETTESKVAAEVAWWRLGSDDRSRSRLRPCAHICPSPPLGGRGRDPRRRRGRVRWAVPAG